MLCKFFYLKFLPLYYRTFKHGRKCCDQVYFTSGMNQIWIIQIHVPVTQLVKVLVVINGRVGLQTIWNQTPLKKFIGIHAIEFDFIESDIKTSFEYI